MFSAAVTLISPDNLNEMCACVKSFYSLVEQTDFSIDDSGECLNGSIFATEFGTKQCYYASFAQDIDVKGPLFAYFVIFGGCCSTNIFPWLRSQTQATSDQTNLGRTQGSPCGSNYRQSGKGRKVVWTTVSMNVWSVTKAWLESEQVWWLGFGTLSWVLLIKNVCGYRATQIFRATVVWPTLPLIRPDAKHCPMIRPFLNTCYNPF